MYFAINRTVYYGLSDRDDSQDTAIMELPECDDWFFHTECLITMHPFENDEGEPRVEWVAHCLKEIGEVGASIGSYADCKTGRAGAREDAKREAEHLNKEHYWRRFLAN